jgi:hypothetical protein
LVCQSELIGGVETHLNDREKKVQNLLLLERLMYLTKVKNEDYRKLVINSRSYATQY